MDTIISFIAIIIIFTLGIWAVDGCYKINEEEKKKEGKNMSKKIYKGYELLKAIANGEIKENSRIDVFTDYGAYITTIKYKDGQLNWKAGEFNTGFLCSKETRFELIEDETIDIESIEELDNTCYDINNMTDDEIECYHNYTRSKINIILQWAKQQEKRIKKLEDKQ